MLTDYKFWYIIRDDFSFITEVAVRFYEGKIETKLVEDIDGNLVSKDVYVRTKRLQEGGELDYLSSTKKITESSGDVCILYHSEDFGQIQTNKELENFLNGEIAKDPGREVVDEQKII